MRPSRFLVPAALLAGFARPSPARAEPPVQLEAAAIVGAASNPRWIANPYALGFGGRAGVDLYGFYGGLSALYYVGGSFGASGFHTLLLGLEAGYTFRLPYIRVRPKVGFGEGTFTQSAPDGVNNPPVSTSVGNVYVEPGVVALIPIGRLFLGADAGAIVLPNFTLASPVMSVAPTAKTYASFSAHGQIGVVF